MLKLEALFDYSELFNAKGLYTHELDHDGFGPDKIIYCINELSELIDSLFYILSTTKFLFTNRAINEVGMSLAKVERK